jgi:hypothetical protein
MPGGLFFSFECDARTPRAHPCGKKKTESQITSGVPACDTVTRRVDALRDASNAIDAKFKLRN